MSQPISPGTDLSNCDREPIHQLGYIQGFGALVALDADWTVARLSANFGAVFATTEPLAIGDAFADHLTPRGLEMLREHLPQAETSGGVARLFGARLTACYRLYDIALHRSGRFIIVELEPHEEPGVSDRTGALRAVTDRLQQSDDIASLCGEAAHYLKRLLGFDRVMVYRFHADESGEVIAEAREPRLESFLNLRYPRTDIPQQARRLYLRNLFRIISDVNAEPVPIESAAGAAEEPLDLTLSTLRAVSPVHIEYLQNMGVGGSLSISIVIRGKLWGLFACHHYASRFLPYPLRTMAELFSQLFSLNLEMVLASSGARMKQRGRELHDRLIARLAGGTTLAESLPVIEEVIGDIIPHDGASALIDGRYRSRGTAPSEEEFLALVPSLDASSTGSIIHTDHLTGLIPAAAPLADRVAGALIIPVSRSSRDYVVLWRRDLPHTVQWAGNPKKSYANGPHGDRLTPRKSFAAWRESVLGRSAPWHDDEVAIAENLRMTLLEVILRISDEANQQRSRAQERQELLIAELNHRVRNILTLIRSLIGQSRGETRDVEEFAGLIGGRIRALAMAHDAITRQHWEPASLHDLIDAESEAYLAGKSDRVQVTGEDALIEPQAFTVLALVLHEMMTNSVKYGSLCDQRGKLTITTTPGRSGDLRITWRESGGPPVKAPKRRGFGSTIIENSIPFELEGEAQVRYLLSGVEADFLVPARYVKRQRASRTSAGKSGGEDMAEMARGVAKDGDGKPVLLVEDSMIIAMDGEEMLRQLGFANVVVAANVDAALREIGKAEPQFALLDYNLGDESSEAIAERLAALGVPFWFVTGYGDALAKLSATKGNGVLQKPYTSTDLEQAIAAMKR